jgi:hypothetical protein
MAKLPNIDLAIIEAKKLSDYLFNLAHVDGAAKAKFFFQFGFSAQEHEAFRQAALEHAATYEATVFETEFGMRYVIDGPLATPSGHTPIVRMVWQVDAGAPAPRLVTAHPLRVERR